MIEEGEAIVLFEEGGKKYLFRAKPEVSKVPGLGVIDGNRLIGREFGEEVELGGRKFIVLPPSLGDRMGTIRRKAQIITEKDAAHIITGCGIRSGSLVVEGGIGSGSLTLALLNAVRPGGRVISYEKREEFIKVAGENIERNNLSEFSVIKNRDITEGIDERDADAMVIDIPNPWDVVGHAAEALRIGGYFAGYSPTISQVEKTVKTLRGFEFAEVRTIEVLVREMVVGELGTRPSFDMLGHTGYLTFGRRVKRALKRA